MKNCLIFTQICGLFTSWLDLQDLGAALCSQSQPCQIDLHMAPGVLSLRPRQSMSWPSLHPENEVQGCSRNSLSQSA